MLTLRLCGGTRETSRALEPDGALGRGLETRDHPQRGRLAAARRAQQREELARGDGEVGFVDRDVVGEALRDVVDLDTGPPLARVAPSCPVD